MGMKIALLGGAGRVGRWMTPALRRNHEVVVLDSVDDEGVVAVDALDRHALAPLLEGFDAVVHLCMGVARDEAEKKDPKVTAWTWTVNVGSVAQTILACADAGVPRFIHMSSLSVFQDAGTHRITEGTEPDSLQPYGLSKRTAEMMLEAITPQLGLDSVSLRLAWPSPDDMAPLWYLPFSGEPKEVRLSDGTVAPAIGGTALAGIIDEELTREFTPGYRIRNAIADESAVFKAPTAG